MLPKIEKNIKRVIRKRSLEILMQLIVLFFIFNIVTELPYVNLLVQNFFVKILLVWMVGIFFFRINHFLQTKAILAFIIIMSFFTFLGSQSYEFLGSLLYVLLLTAVITFILSEKDSF